MNGNEYDNKNDDRRDLWHAISPLYVRPQRQLDDQVVILPVLTKNTLSMIYKYRSKNHHSRDSWDILININVM